jgi:hypothetical protein
MRPHHVDREGWTERKSPVFSSGAFLRKDNSLRQKYRGPQVGIQAKLDLIEVG